MPDRMPRLARVLLLRVQETIGPVPTVPPTLRGRPLHECHDDAIAPQCPSMAHPACGYPGCGGHDGAAAACLAVGYLLCVQHIAGASGPDGGAAQLPAAGFLVVSECVADRHGSASGAECGVD